MTRPTGLPSSSRAAANWVDEAKRTTAPRAAEQSIMTPETAYAEAMKYENRANPYPFFDELRKTPVARVANGIYAVTGYRELVVFQKWRWPCLHRPSKGIAIDKQANHNVTRVLPC